MPQGDRGGGQRFHRLDVLVNAAALTDRGTILDTSEERYNEIFNVNARAPFFLIQDAAKIMNREKIAGSIVNIQIDVGAWRPAVHRRLLRLQGRARGADQECRPCAGAPPHPRQRPQHRLDVDAGRGPHHEGPITAPRTAGSTRRSKRSRSAGLIDPHEVARACVYLASDESGLMTGSNIDFDQNVIGAGDPPLEP